MKRILLSIITITLLFVSSFITVNAAVSGTAVASTGFLENAVSNVGFPILCCAVMAWFIYQTLKDHTIIKNDVLNKALNLWTDLIEELQKNTESINDMCELIKTNKEIEAALKQKEDTSNE